MKLVLTAERQRRCVICDLHDNGPRTSWGVGITWWELVGLWVLQALGMKCPPCAHHHGTSATHFPPHPGEPCWTELIPLCLADVHPDHDAHHLGESECLSVPGHALHAQGVHHPLPPGAERPQAQAEPEGGGDGSHHVQQVLSERRLPSQWRGQIRAV